MCLVLRLQANNVEHYFFLKNVSFGLKALLGHLKFHYFGALKRIVGLFEVGLCEVLVHSLCIIAVDSSRHPPSFGESVKVPG